MKNWIKIILTTILVLVIDLVTKRFLFKIDYFNLIPNVISVAGHVENTGAAWGILSGNTIGLIFVSIVMIIALFVFNHFVKSKNTFYCLGFGFVIGGAVGNLFDRVAFNYVRDFIFLDFWPTFPVFNIADSFITVAVFLVIIFYRKDLDESLNQIFPKKENV